MSDNQPPIPPPPPPLPDHPLFVKGGLPPELLEQEDEYVEKRLQKQLQFKMIGAIESENIELLRSLIESGVNTNAIIQLVKTPLTLALDQEPVSYDLVQLLLKSGADPNMPETSPWSVRPLLQSIQKNLINVFKVLIHHGADMSACDNCGNSPLHFAAQFGRTDMLNFLLANNPELEIDVKDNCLKTPFHRACEQRHLGIADILLKKGADINWKNKYGWSPLFRAIMFSQIDVVQFLIDNNADLHVKNAKNDTPLHIACRCVKPENCQADTATSFDFSRRMWKIPSEELKALIQANIYSNYEIVKLLVNSGAPLDIRNVHDEAPIHLAQDVDILIYLVQAGAVIDQGMLLLDVDEEHVARITGRSIGLQNWLIDKYLQQFSLRWCARNVIRRRLAFSREITANIEKLPLPDALKKFLSVHTSVTE